MKYICKQINTLMYSLFRESVHCPELDFAILLDFNKYVETSNQILICI